MKRLAFRVATMRCKDTIRIDDVHGEPITCFQSDTTYPFYYDWQRVEFMTYDEAGLTHIFDGMDKFMHQFFDTIVLYQTATDAPIDDDQYKKLEKLYLKQSNLIVPE